MLLSDSDLGACKDGGLYVNIHSEKNPNGEVADSSCRNLLYLL